MTHERDSFGGRTLHAGRLSVYVGPLVDPDSGRAHRPCLSARWHSFGFALVATLRGRGALVIVRRKAVAS